MDLDAPLAPTVSGIPVQKNTEITWKLVTGGGGNGSYRFRINAGVWQAIASSTLKYNANKEGVYIVDVQEGDAFGHWSLSGTSQTEVDQTKPKAPIFDTNLPKLQNQKALHFTWSTGGSADALNTYRYYFNKSDTIGSRETSVTQFDTTVANNGTYRLYLWQKDKAGNWSDSSFWEIKVDSTVLSAPLISAFPWATTTTLSWQVSSSAGGKGDIYYKINDPNNVSSGTKLVGSTVTSTGVDGQSYTLYALEKDAANNVSGVSSAKITLDATVPAAPEMTPPLTPTKNRKPTWTWKTSGSGSTAGNGKFQFALGSSASGLNSKTAVTQISFTPSSDLSDGTYTLWVRELDDAGNLGIVSSATIIVDGTAPVLSLVGVEQNATVLLDGNYAGITKGVQLKAIDALDGDISSKIIVSTNVNTKIVGTYTESYSISDAVGNSSSMSRTIKVRGWELIVRSDKNKEDESWPSNVVIDRLGNIYGLFGGSEKKWIRKLENSKWISLETITDPNGYALNRTKLVVNGDGEAYYSSGSEVSVTIKCLTRTISPVVINEPIIDWGVNAKGSIYMLYSAKGPTSPYFTSPQIDIWDSYYGRWNSYSNLNSQEGLSHWFYCGYSDMLTGSNRFVNPKGYSIGTVSSNGFSEKIFTGSNQHFSIGHIVENNNEFLFDSLGIKLFKINAGGTVKINPPTGTKKLFPAWFQSNPAAFIQETSNSGLTIQTYAANSWSKPLAEFSLIPNTEPIDVGGVNVENWNGKFLSVSSSKIIIAVERKEFEGGGPSASWIEIRELKIF